MNKLKKLAFLAIFAGTIFVISSCGDDDVKAEFMDLVIVERNSGTLSTINTNEGTLAEQFNFTLNGQDLINIRALVYNPLNEKYYASRAVQGGGGDLLEIDPTTKVATVINDNVPVGNSPAWDNISDITINNGGDLLVSLYDNSLGELALSIFETNGDRGATTDISEELCCGGGLTIDGDSYALGVGEPARIKIINSSGTVTSTLDLDATGTPIQLNSSFVQHLLTFTEDVYFGTVLDNSTGGAGTTYIVQISKTTGAITITNTLSERHHGLAFVPRNVLEN